MGVDVAHLRYVFAHAEWNCATGVVGVHPVAFLVLAPHQSFWRDMGRSQRSRRTHQAKEASWRPGRTMAFASRDWPTVLWYTYSALVPLAASARGHACRDRDGLRSYINGTTPCAKPTSPANNICRMQYIMYLPTATVNPSSSTSCVRALDQQPVGTNSFAKAESSLIGALKSKSVQYTLRSKCTSFTYATPDQRQ